ncbi:acyl-CoA-binding domain-containing protein 5-B isoform X1 [Lycorma delicatula]|uniref:acyl-CoA-binding domain-containing protein 5-B isoform X1 n=1 Tax=Lycorma delicatula TaxID=130591 RepID=UPI003F510382
MSYEEKFKAAVNVIRNLPKNGAYQPSHELMLRFYAYYKQATEGPNTMPKPNFWEMIKKAKWDAWSKLGNMSREQAMINYVEELKKIVETMAYTDNVASFITSLDSFYESVPAEDLQLLIGPVIEKVCSQPGSPLSGSPLASREASPQRISTKTSTKHITSSLETSPASSYSASPLPPDTDEEEDFLDTFEQTETEHSAVKDANSVIKNKHHDNPYKAMNGSTGMPLADKGDRGRHRDKNNIHNAHIRNNKVAAELCRSQRGISTEGQIPEILQTVAFKTDSEIPCQATPFSSAEETQRNVIAKVNISEVIHQTISSLRKDLDNLNIKVSTVERNYQQMAEDLKRNKAPDWWPLGEMPIPAAVFFIVWPFIVQGILLWIQRRKIHT